MKAGCKQSDGVLLHLFFDPEDGGDIYLLNVDFLSTDYTALYPGRHNSTTDVYSGTYKETKRFQTPWWKIRPTVGQTRLRDGPFPQARGTGIGSLPFCASPYTAKAAKALRIATGGLYWCRYILSAVYTCRVFESSDDIVCSVTFSLPPSSEAMPESSSNGIAVGFNKGTSDFRHETEQTVSLPGSAFCFHLYNAALYWCVTQ
jgi:hypothetical protein